MIYMLWDENKVEKIGDKFSPKGISILVDDFISAELIYDMILEEYGEEYMNGEENEDI